MVANLIFLKISSSFLAIGYQNMPSYWSFSLHRLYPWCSNAEKGLVDSITELQIQIGISLPVLLSSTLSVWVFAKKLWNDMSQNIVLTVPMGHFLRHQLPFPGQHPFLLVSLCFPDCLANPASSAWNEAGSDPLLKEKPKSPHAWELHRLSHFLRPMW